MALDQHLIIKMRLSLQRALLGVVSSRLRAVVFSINESFMDIRCYFDGPISEEDEDSISCMETEVLADCDPDQTVNAQCIRADVPNVINDDGVWVYQRREGELNKC